MRNEPPAPAPAPHTVFFKIGRWAEARATGWGIVALVLLGVLATIATLGGAGALIMR